MTKGIKLDKEKLRMDLLDFDALEGLAEALTFGASKYGDNNWKLGIDNNRLVGALLRHLSAFLRGEDIDAESGVPHIDLLGANWMFLSSNIKLRPHLDNRTHTRHPHGDFGAGVESNPSPAEEVGPSLEDVMREWIVKDLCPPWGTGIPTSQWHWKVDPARWTVNDIEITFETDK